ncbi:MAG TPA: N-acetylglucosamine-6-phosphate deacetylase [Chloroflexota bacterium]|nr:N-acetylglucosamine-6-phosphate deacetylase [Chloroflexota bacterium]
MLHISGTVISPGEAPRLGIVRVDGVRVDSVESGPASEDRYVAPGFIDVHVHGGGGADFMDGTPKAIRTICRYHAAGGTTGLLATTAAAPTDDLLRVLDVIAQVQREGTGGAAIFGVHLEGPWFAQGKHGCHLPAHVRPPRPQDFLRILDAHPGLVRWVTLAPEIEGALELIAALSERGIVPGAGHTEATEPQIERAIGAGLRHVTHLYNAMSTITKDGPRRIPGLVETALSRDDLTAEVIADGHHLAPALLKIAARAKGPARVLLVTDAMRGAGMPDGTYTFGPQNGTPAIVENGVARTMDNSGFASSTVQTVDLVRVMVEQAGCSITDSVQMASTTPAAALGLANCKGRLVPGYDADVVVFDASWRVRQTQVQGELVYSDP